ncbi:uncharacterized protein CXorf65 homolog isoform X2 [Macrotis lagotis]|uniref:uncharacterized protein CXorf65 homolog isoform X2 n=1 Tax=Macrotis lagotis TaxID=92651 RepID=UPI003D698850
MFIIIKYGDNQQFLVNTNCSVLLLLHYIRHKMGLKNSELIDLCDEAGSLKLLFLVKFPGESATKFFQSRNSYYICKVERGIPDALKSQCDFLEKSRIKMLRGQDSKKISPIDSYMNISSKTLGRIGATGIAEEEPTTRRGASLKGKAESSKRDKHR